MRRLPLVWLMLVSLSPLAAGSLRAEPPSMKTFRHWFAACDNLRACSAYGFATTIDETLVGGWIRLDRGGEAVARPSLRVGFSLADGGDDSPKELTLRIGGDPTLGPFPIEEGDNFFSAKIPDAAVPALLGALRKADFVQLRIGETDGETIEATLSLDGASAAMLRLDEEQRRIGTVTALVKPGSKPAASIPPVPELPVIHAAAPSAETEPTLPPAVLALAKTGHCSEEIDRIEPVVADLGGGKRLYGAYCGSGAYNFSAQFWIADQDGTPEPAHFVLPPALASNDDEGGGLEEQGILINPDFDPATMTLSAYAKGRGLGDCGESQQWVWDGTAFRLAHYEAMGACEGVPPGDWPVIYRTEIR